MFSAKSKRKICSFTVELSRKTFVWMQCTVHPQRQKLNLEANCCRHLQLPIARRPSIVIPGLKACDQTSFHGFTTYWMIKKALSCTVHCVENTASHQNGVGQCTMLTVSPGEADQTSEIHSGAVLQNLMQLLPEALQVQQRQAVLD